mgnify:CR=1 FL=1
MRSLSISLSPIASTLAHKVRSLGYALIAVAFALPFVAIPFGYSTAFQAGESLARNLFALFVLALIAWLTIKRRSDMTKALAQLLLGVLMCLFVGSNFAVAITEEQQAKQQLQQMLEFSEKHAASFNDLAARVDKVDLNSTLSSENITSPSGLATAKATVAQFRALLAERRLLLQTYLTELDRYLSELPPGNFKDGAMSGVAAERASTVKLYSDLDRSQTAWVEAISDVLDWSTGQSGKLFMKGSQLMFTSVRQKDELTALVNRASAVEDDLNKVLKATKVAQAAAQEKMKVNVQAAEKLLRK